MPRDQVSSDCSAVADSRRLMMEQFSPWWSPMRSSEESQTQPHKPSQLCDSELFESQAVLHEMIHLPSRFTSWTERIRWTSRTSFRTRAYYHHRSTLSDWQDLWDMVSWWRLCNSSGSSSCQRLFRLQRQVAWFKCARVLRWINWCLHQLVSKGIHDWSTLCWRWCLGIAVFFTAMTVAEGGGKRAVEHKLRDMYVPTLKANYLVWPAVQLINFRLMPLQFQLVSHNSLEPLEPFDIC